MISPEASRVPLPFELDGGQKRLGSVSGGSPFGHIILTVCLMNNRPVRAKAWIELTIDHTIAFIRPHHDYGSQNMGSSQRRYRRQLISLSHSHQGTYPRQECCFQSFPNYGRMPPKAQQTKKISTKRKHMLLAFLLHARDIGKWG